MKKVAKKAVRIFPEEEALIEKEYVTNNKSAAQVIYEWRMAYEDWKADQTLS